MGEGESRDLGPKAFAVGKEASHRHHALCNTNVRTPRMGFINTSDKAALLRRLLAEECTASDERCCGVYLRCILTRTHTENGRTAGADARSRARSLLRTRCRAILARAPSPVGAHRQREAMGERRSAAAAIASAVTLRPRCQPCRERRAGTAPAPRAPSPARRGRSPALQEGTAAAAALPAVGAAAEAAPEAGAGGGRAPLGDRRVSRPRVLEVSHDIIITLLSRGPGPLTSPGRPAPWHREPSNDGPLLLLSGRGQQHAGRNAPTSPQPRESKELPPQNTHAHKMFATKLPPFGQKLSVTHKGSEAVSSRHFLPKWDFFFFGFLTQCWKLLMAFHLHRG